MGDSRTAFEPVCGAPNIKEHLTDDILRNCRITDHPLDEAKHFYAVTGEQDVHGGFITLRNVLQKHYVGGTFFLFRRITGGVSQLAMARRVGRSG
jgi:hypothetical protein